MWFLKKIKKYLGSSSKKLCEMSRIIDKKLKEKKISEWLACGDAKKCLNQMFVEISEEVKRKSSENKKYSEKEIKNAINERVRYWSSYFDKSRNLKEFELCSFCSYLLQLKKEILEISNETFLKLMEIYSDGDFLDYDNRNKKMSVPVIILDFFERNNLIDKKHRNSFIKSYITILSEKKNQTDFEKELDTLKEVFDSEIYTFIENLKIGNREQFIEILNEYDGDERKIRKKLKVC
ncbi:MAG: hypothetical protein FWC41_04990 [Firmicutes bacterium]|nr:hypothetical protein [Bacillota bacterium]